MITEEEMPLTFSETEDVELDWGWTGRYLAGAVNILGGKGGVGKNLTIYDAAARISTGTAFPGDPAEPYPASPCVIVTREDHEPVAKGRLEAAGADSGMVYSASEVGGVGFRLPTHIGYLHELIVKTRARFVALDPLISISEVSLTSAKIRWLLDDLNKVAKDTGAVVVVTAHHTKKDELAGSAQIPAAVRVVMAARLDAEDPERRVLSVVKGNCTAAPSDLFYRIVEADNGHPRIDYLTGVTRPAAACSNVDRVRAVLSDVPMTAQDIAAESGVQCDQVRTILSRLCRQGRAVQASRGLYVAAADVSSQVSDITPAQDVTAA